jgi:ribosome-binding ATPase YchF (GTP1/OBG family)
VAEGEQPPDAVLAAARQAGSEVIVLSARIEQELAELPPEEAAEFLTDLQLVEPALSRMIQASYTALDRLSFFTIGKDECRAWTVRRGALAPEAAGIIHSDMQRGFIRAVVCAYDDLRACGDYPAAKAAHKVREEGKSYAVQDGDILEIRFNV